jgi:TonB family protein
MHRAPVAYPQAALKAGVQGTVVVEVKLDVAANVNDARVVSGPDELRKAALESVLKWHFTREAANGVRQVSIRFALPSQAKGTAPASGLTGGVAGGVAAGVRGGVVGGVPGGVRGGGPTNAEMKPLKSIETAGLAPAARDELLAKIPVRAGDAMNKDSIGKIQTAMREFDEHLTLGISSTEDGTVVRIAAPEAQSQAAAGQKIRVGGNVQQTKLIQKPVPAYPVEAKEQRIQGVVKLQATIGKDGRVESLEVLSGHPLLASAALDAVKNWVYETTLLNGNPVEVVTQIDVNFTLSQ